MPTLSLKGGLKKNPGAHQGRSPLGKGRGPPSPKRNRSFSVMEALEALRAMEKKEFFTFVAFFNIVKHLKGSSRPALHNPKGPPSKRYDTLSSNADPLGQGVGGP